MKISWAYGVTTVPARAGELLPRTLRSLAAGGFDRPWLFVDDCRYPFHDKDYERFGCPVTNRYPRVGAWGNWLLGLTELWIRSPGCDYYAMFQDDLVCVRGLREYLEQCLQETHEAHASDKEIIAAFDQDVALRKRVSEYLARRTPLRYVNLYTVSQNEELADGRQGFYPSNQMGRGALALVFPKDAVEVLLSDIGVVSKPCHCNRPDSKIDGSVAGAMKRTGYTELVHYPSLVEHTGVDSAIGHKIGPAYRSAPSFPGEDCDVRTLLRGAKT